MRVRSASGFALVDLLFVCGIIGILSGIAFPRLMTAKGAATSASAVASLRVIGSGQITFAITCGNGFYAPSLTLLAKPPAGSNEGFIRPDLAYVDNPVKSGYQFQMDAAPFGGAPDTCNFLGAGQTGEAFRAAADPLDPNNKRFFAINASNVVWEDQASLWAVMPEAADPPNGAPLAR